VIPPLGRGIGQLQAPSSTFHSFDSKEELAVVLPVIIQAEMAIQATPHTTIIAT
jgi:hypothetical protein